MKPGKIILRIGLFLVGVLIILFVIHSFFKISSKRVFQMAAGFYSEQKDDLDAVYIGASNVYAFWQAPLGFERSGITVYPYSTPEMPAQAMTYVVEETKKTQPNALFILCLNNFRYDNLDYEVSALHYLTDYMPYSSTRARLLEELKKGLDEEEYDPLEFTFPFIRFHPRWNELEDKDFNFKYNRLKGATVTSNFLKRSYQKGADFVLSTDSEDLQDIAEEELRRQLEWFKETKTPVLFVINPQVVNTKEQNRLNRIAEIVEAEDFDILNMQPLMNEMGLDPVDDYYDQRHTNVHGSLKYTNYLTDYLVEHYGFTNKKRQAGYESWEEAAQKFETVVNPYLLDFEFAEAPRDKTLSAPSVQCKLNKKGAAEVSWEPIDGAEGYLVYRKSQDRETKELNAYTCIAKLNAASSSYVDETIDQENYSYRYTVVPVRSENGTVYYGKFDQRGVKPKAE